MKKIGIGISHTRPDFYGTPIRDTSSSVGDPLKLFGWIFNKCGAAYNKTVKATRKDLRAAYVHNGNFERSNQWVKDVPYDVRNAAMIDAVKAIKAHKGKQKMNRNGFHVKLRSKRDDQCLSLEKKFWNLKRGTFSGLFGPEVMESSKKLPDKLPYDSRVVKDRMNRYYFCVPTKLDIKEEYENNNRIIVLDPGVRTFLTGYNQDGSVTKITHGDPHRLFSLGLHADKLRSKMITLPKGKKKNTKKNKMRKALLRIYNRIRNLTSEIHAKACKWLLQNHEIILLPEVKSSQMIKKEDRKIVSKTVLH